MSSAGDRINGSPPSVRRRPDRADVCQIANFEISALQRIADDLPSPELINDGQQTAPSKRIIAQFPQYGDLKTTIGTQMAERIGLETIRSKCPHFNAWLDRLEKLGAKSPSRR